MRICRRNLERIGEAQAYELSKRLRYSQKSVQTPLGVATANTYDDDIVLATVFRAGLPLHQGFLHVFDKAENAFVSAYPGDNEERRKAFALKAAPLRKKITVMKTATEKLL